MAGLLCISSDLLLEVHDICAKLFSISEFCLFYNSLSDARSSIEFHQVASGNGLLPDSQC